MDLAMHPGCWSWLDPVKARSSYGMPGQAVVLTEDEHALGREELGTDKKKVSLRHFTISRRSVHGAGFSIIDHSVNGTFLNTVKLTPEVPAPLSDGDLITLIKPHEMETDFAYRFCVKRGPGSGGITGEADAPRLENRSDTVQDLSGAVVEEEPVDNVMTQERVMRAKGLSVDLGEGPTLIHSSTQPKARKNTAILVPGGLTVGEADKPAPPRPTDSMLSVHASVPAATKPPRKMTTVEVDLDNWCVRANTAVVASRCHCRSDSAHTRTCSR